MKNVFIASLVATSIASIISILPQSNQSLLEGEFMLDTSPVYIPTIGNQAWADVAFGGTNFMAVWADPKNYPFDIYGTRVTQEGLVLDIGGIAISTAAEHQLNPSVIFDGTNYFVVWEDYRNGTEPDIYGSRISSDGTVLDANGILISNAGGNQDKPSVTFDGTNFLAVWQDSRNGSYDIYGARISTSGTVLDPNGIPICTQPESPGHPSVEFDGTNYLVVWNQYNTSWETDIYGARITPSGAVIDPNGFAISFSQFNQEFPKIAFDGTNYLVTWTDYRGGYDPDIFAARITQSGNVLEPDGIAVSTEADTVYRNQDMQSIAFDGTNYLIVYRNSDDNYYDAIFGTRVSPTGNVLDPDGKLVCPVSNLPELQDAYPSIAFGNSNYLVVWEHTPCMWYPYCFDIYGTRVAPDLSIFDPQGIVASSDGYDFYEQWDPAAAFDGTKYLIVWEDDRVSPTSDIYGSIITTNPSNPNPYIIVISAASDWQWYPAVVIGDSLYLVVWIDERSGNPDIYGTRIKTNGEVLDPGGIEISSTSEDQENPKVAFDGTNFLVCWDDERTSDNDIYCARIDQQGNVIDGDGILITASNYDQVFPAVCFGGMNYFVVWQDFRGNDDDIYGARITPSGTVLDPNGIVISNAAGDQEDPKVSYDGSNFLVVWDDERSGVDDVYGARVTPAGTILDPNGIPISTANDQQEYASVVFNGTNFLVAWDDFRNNTDTADVYFAEVNTAGSIISENPLVTGYGDQF
jgi:hypothetical protein